MRLFDCSSKDLRLALLLPGEEICIVGAIEMQCLYGQICVRATRLQGQNYDEHRFSWLVAPVHHSPPIKLICPAIEEGKATAPVNAHRLKWRIRQVLPAMAFCLDNMMMVVNLFRFPQKMRKFSVNSTTDQP